MNRLKRWHRERQVRIICLFLVLGVFTVLGAGYCLAEEEISDEGGDGFQGWSVEGLVEFENHLSTRGDQNLDDANVKNEFRGRFRIQSGGEDLYLVAVPDIHVSSGLLDSSLGRVSYNDTSEIKNNLRITSESYEVSFNELYINWSRESWRLRAGNQIYAWGTADVFNPTSYFNPLDMRELLFKGEDENKFGVPSVSGMFFLGDHTLETVWAPVHVPGKIAGHDDFWRVNPDNYSLPVVFDEGDELDIDPSNFGWGARLSSSFGGADLSLSAFRGPDREPLYRPFRILVTDNTPVSVELRPEYPIVTMMGMDFSMTLGKFVVQLEAAFSPNKRGIEEQSVQDVSRVRFPYSVKKSNYLWYSAGFNYFIPLYAIFEEHEGETVLTVEWSQAEFQKSGLLSPIFTEILSFRLEDTFFESRLSLSLAWVLDTRTSGHALWPKAGYDFQNGFSTEIAYASMNGNSSAPNTTESIFYYYRDNDILTWTVSYDF